MNQFQLQRPSRFDVALTEPHILNQLTSVKQFEILLHCVRNAFHGKLIINKSEWAGALNSTYETIRDTIRNFENIGVLTHDGGCEYTFNYYKDMVQDDKGYVKAYEFLYDESFYALGLPSVRAMFYVLGRIAQQSVFQNRKAPARIDVLSWYSRDYEKRIFPLNHRYEVTAIIENIKKYIETDGILHNGQYVYITGLKAEFNKVLYSENKSNWLKHYLKLEGISIHSFHLKHLIQSFDHLVYTTSFETAKEAIVRAFYNLNTQETTDSKAKRIIGLFYMDQAEGQEYSEAVHEFNEYYLQPILERMAEELSQQAKYTDVRFWLNKAKGFGSFFFEKYIKPLKETANRKPLISSTHELRNYINDIDKKIPSVAKSIWNLKGLENIRDEYNRFFRPLYNELRNREANEFSFTQPFRIYNWLEDTTE